MRVVRVGCDVQNLIFNVVGQNYFVERPFRLLRHENFFCRLLFNAIFLIPNRFYWHIYPSITILKSDFRMQLRVQSPPNL